MRPFPAGSGCSGNRVKWWLYAGKRALASEHGLEICQNLRMVKDQRLRQGIQRIIRRMGRIVPGAQGFGIARPACESHGQRVLAGVAVRPTRTVSGTCLARDRQASGPGAP